MPIIEPNGVPSFESFKEPTIQVTETTKKVRAVIDPDDTPENAVKEEQLKKQTEQSNYEKEEESNDSTESKEPVRKSIESSDPEIREVIDQFERARELGMFMGLPDDFKFDGSPEKTEEAFRIDQDTRNSLAFKQLESQIQDPYLREAVEYGINGGKFADMKSYLQAQKSYLEISNLEIKDDTQAKDVITKELKQKGLKDNVIKLTLEQHEDEGTLLTEAQDIVKTWTKEKEAQKKQLEAQSRQQREAEERENKEYERNFIDTLKKTNLPKQKQDQVLGAFDPINIDGNTYTRYELIRSTIENNPEHFIQYLDLLNSYNPKTGFELSQFKAQGKTEQTKKIHDILFKSSSKTKGARTYEEEPNLAQMFRNPVDRNIEVH